MILSDILRFLFVYAVFLFGFSAGVVYFNDKAQQCVDFFHILISVVLLLPNILPLFVPSGGHAAH